MGPGTGQKTTQQQNPQLSRLPYRWLTTTSCVECNSLSTHALNYVPIKVKTQKESMFLVLEGSNTFIIISKTHWSSVTDRDQSIPGTRVLKPYPGTRQMDGSMSTRGTRFSSSTKPGQGTRLVWWKPKRMLRYTPGWRQFKYWLIPGNIRQWLPILAISCTWPFLITPKVYQRPSVILDVCNEGIRLRMDKSCFQISQTVIFW